jgi:hypothetical protein
MAIEVSAGDLDGDSKADLVVFNANSGGISFFKNNSSVGRLLFHRIFGGSVFETVSTT